MFGRIASLTAVGAFIGGAVIGLIRLQGVRAKAATLNRVDTGSVW